MRRASAGARARRALGAGALVAGALGPGCARGSRSSDAAAAQDAAAVVSAPSATAPGGPRPGMVWVPAGVLRAGSELDDVPRVADVEPPAADVPMGGFYIDVLPWPNEAGAIATANVTRDEAKRQCEERGKRLCSELEWERACKGPNNSRYEYGSTYDSRVCGAGVLSDAASLRPSGQRSGCRSGFGARDMHGGAAEWTDSRWGRGAARDLGVSKGGNDVTGELGTRCSSARPLAPGDRSASVGFRCCSGPRNQAEVELEVKKGPAFESAAGGGLRAPPLDALDGAACGPPKAPSPCSIGRAWTWRPAPNVELSVSGGCMGHDPHARCAVGVSQWIGDRRQVLAQVDTRLAIPEVVPQTYRDPARHRCSLRDARFRRSFSG